MKRPARRTGSALRTRDHISDDHDHPDQGNYDPYSDGGAALRAALTPASQAPLEALRAAWEPRIQDPRTIFTTHRPTP